MAEVLTLTTPITTPNTINYKVTDMVLHFEPPARSSYLITLVPNVGARVVYSIFDSTDNSNLATSRLTALNKVNLTTNSLQKRILEFAVTDGQLPAGSVTGTPD